MQGKRGGDRPADLFDYIYDIMALIDFDPAKSARNERERGIAFERFADMDFETAIAIEDTRKDLRGKTTARARHDRRQASCGGDYAPRGGDPGHQPAEGEQERGTRVCEITPAVLTPRTLSGRPKRFRRHDRSWRSCRRRRSTPCGAIAASAVPRSAPRRSSSACASIAMLWLRTERPAPDGRSERARLCVHMRGRPGSRPSAPPLDVERWQRPVVKIAERPHADRCRTSNRLSPATPTRPVLGQFRPYPRRFTTSERRPA